MPAAADEQEDLEKKIAKYEEKLGELGARSKTLSSEISYMETQISLTETRIQNSLVQIANTEDMIEKLVVEIDDLKNRIDHLEGSIDYQRVLLNNRSRERYKSKEVSPLLVIFGTETINSLIRKMEYLKLIEIQDNKILGEMERTKQSYDTQKGLFEGKKSEEESLKARLVTEKANLDAYKNQLGDQRRSKEKLLEVTQNDEEKYQDLLEDARKELNQIMGAVGVLKLQDGEHVDKGQMIGTQGNTGYSFGEHLHFGVYRYSSFDDIEGWDWYYSNYVNPRDVLKSKTVFWNTGCESSYNRSVGDGNWAWPISSPTVSQGFGNTCWSYLYGGKVHPAFDMYGAHGSAVYAADGGDAYFCRNCLGDGGNGVFIFHDDNYMTVYWHLR